MKCKHCGATNKLQNEKEFQWTFWKVVWLIVLFLIIIPFWVGLFWGLFF